MQGPGQAVLGNTVPVPEMVEDHPLGMTQSDASQLHAHAAADEPADLGQKVSEGQIPGVMSGVNHKC